jgi:pantothenate kinase-related protein Tda10
MSEDDVIDRAFVIGLSGPSSSGKTTLARLLRTVFNVPASETTNGRSSKLFIFHQDDAYKTDTEFVSHHAMLNSGLPISHEMPQNPLRNHALRSPTSRLGLCRRH